MHDWTSMAIVLQSLKPWLLTTHASNNSSACPTLRYNVVAAICGGDSGSSLCQVQVCLVLPACGFGGFPYTSRKKKKQKRYCGMRFSIRYIEAGMWRIPKEHDGF